MSLKWFEGFESDWAVSGGEMDDPGGYDSGLAVVGGGGSNAISTAYGRNGSIGARHNSGGGAAVMYGQKTMALGSEFLMQCASVWHSGTRTIYIMGAQEGATRHIELYWQATSGDLRLVNNGVDYNLGHPATGLFHFIEVKCKIANAGYIIVRVDSVEVLNTGTIDTLGAVGTGACDIGWIMDRYSGTNTSYNAYYDDFAFCAIDGVAPVASSSEWLGDARVVRLVPNGAGASADFTPLSSTNHSNVDDGANSDNDTTYNHSDVVGEKDSFAFGDLASSPLTVLGVRQHTSMRKDDVGPRTARTLLRIAGVDYESADLNVIDSWQTFQSFYPTNPATGAAWTEAEINALEAGYKVQA